MLAVVVGLVITVGLALELAVLAVAVRALMAQPEFLERSIQAAVVAGVIKEMEALEALA
jgi:hypothetical protein